MTALSVDASSYYGTGHSARLSNNHSVEGSLIRNAIYSHEGRQLVRLTANKRLLVIKKFCRGRVILRFPGTNWSVGAKSRLSASP